MPLRKIMKGLPRDKLPADGLMTRDLEALTPCQVACTERLGNALQLEQETYLLRHPEVKAMLELFISKMSQKNKRKEVLKEAAEYLTRPAAELDKEILERLNLLAEESYTWGMDLPKPYVDDMLMIDLRKLINTHYKTEAPKMASPASASMNTESSSFMSIQTSDTTLSTPVRSSNNSTHQGEILDSYCNYKVDVCYEKFLDGIDFEILNRKETKQGFEICIVSFETEIDDFNVNGSIEPIPTPEMTLSETMFLFVSNTVDKAIFLRVDDELLNYDTAYIELSKAVERAMEVPVIEIRLDITKLLQDAYAGFEFNIMEKERVAAEIAWEKRMRKKLKKTLRRLDNFKGYITPPTPKSEISSHESYKIPPPRPCICHPQYHYNRYPKDRFGIYLPSENNFSTGNVTVSPEISESSDDEHGEETVAC